MGYTRIDKEARKFDNDGNVKVSIEVDNAGIGGGGGGGSSQQKVYDGATWQNQLGDSSGRAIIKQKKFYSAADITELSSSTDLNLWVAAYSDGVLTKKYNAEHTAGYDPTISYCTYPSLGDGNKCLRIVYNYTGSNLVSVLASVQDWTFDSSLAPAASIAKGAISHPGANSSEGTDVCSITPSGGSAGAQYTIVVSGADSDKYRLANTTAGTTGTTITASLGDTIVLETSTDFSYGAAGYNHSVTVTNTEDVGSTSANTTVATTQAAAPPATLTNGTITSPANDAAAGTDVCTLTPGGGGGSATYSLVLSGANAGLYQINNITSGTTGSTVAANSGDSIVLETASLFNLGATGYSHSVTVTNTESVGSTTANVTINTTQAADPSWSNNKYWQRPSDDDISSWGGPTVGPWGDMNTIGAPGHTDAFSASFWINHTTSGAPSGSTYSHLVGVYDGDHDPRILFNLYHYGHAAYGTTIRAQCSCYFYGSGTNVNLTGGYHYLANDTWYNIIIVKNATVDSASVANADVTYYINGVADTTSGASGTWNTSTPTTLNNSQNAVYRTSVAGHAGWKYDEAAFFNKALNATEISQIYNSGTPQDISGISGLKGYYRFGDGDSAGDGSGTADSYDTIYDMSGDAGGNDIELIDYSGSETDMIKDY